MNWYAGKCQTTLTRSSWICWEVSHDHDHQRGNGQHLGRRRPGRCTRQPPSAADYIEESDRGGEDQGEDGRRKGRGGIRPDQSITFRTSPVELFRPLESGENMNVIITATRHCARCDNDLPLEALNGSQRYCAPCSALSRKEWSARQRSKSSAVISGATSAPGINETAAAETIASLRANHELHPVDADRAATLVS